MDISGKRKVKKIPRQRTKIIHGKLYLKSSDYRGIELSQVVDKKIIAIGSSRVEGEYFNEPAVVLFFEDGTKHTFVIQSEIP